MRVVWLGDDTYIVEYVDESLNEGIDLAQSSVRSILGINVGSSILAGSLDITRVSNISINMIVGNRGGNISDDYSCCCCIIGSRWGEW